MTRASRELAITHGGQLAAPRLLGHDDAEFLENPLAEIDDSPPHDAVIGPLSMIAARVVRCSIAQTGRLSRRLAINQPDRPMGVELEYPVANDLKRHPANLRRLGARRFRKSPPAPEWAWRTSAFVPSNQTRGDSGIVVRVTRSGT
jgi:hypothetical protein